VVDDRDRGEARAPAPQDLARICRALNASGARYVLIGGFAVSAHGAGRPTKDIDLLVDPSAENIGRIREALEILPDRAVRDIADDDVRNYAVVRIADEILIDLMSQAGGVTYDEAIADAETAEIDGVEIPVASKVTLIRTKQTNRPSDLADRHFLQSRIDEERAAQKKDSTA
jgi:hypothetical protein